MTNERPNLERYDHGHLYDDEIARMYGPPDTCCKPCDKAGRTSAAQRRYWHAEQAARCARIAYRLAILGLVLGVVGAVLATIAMVTG